MCAIFGIGFMKNNMLDKSAARRNSFTIRRIINRLFINSEDRGRRASGIAFTTPHDIKVLKKDMTASDFIETDEYKKILRGNINFHSVNAPKLISIIGHCRWPTKGEPEDNNNNHPIIAKNLIGIHNGVISNDESIFSMFKHTDGFDRSGLVDSEVIFRLIHYYRPIHCERRTGEHMVKSIGMALQLLKGGYACAMVDATAPWMMWLFKNTSPTDIRYYGELGIVIFSTSDRIITESVEDIDLGGYQVIPYSNDEAVEFDLSMNSYFKFNHRTDKAP